MFSEPRYHLDEKAQLTLSPGTKVIITAITHRGSGYTYEINWFHDGGMKSGFVEESLIEPLGPEETIGFSKEP